MTQRNWLVLGAVLAFLIGGLWVVGATRNSGSASARALPTPTANASVESVASAKGNIVPARYARISFGTSGTIAQVIVKEGDQVKAGDALAQLDTGDLKLQLQSAQDALGVATATLEQFKMGASPDEIAAAQAGVRSAQAEYDRIKNGPSAAEKSILEADVAKADAARKAAQAAFDRVGGNLNPNIGMLPESLALQKATQDYSIAKANYDLKTRVDAASVAAAEAAVYNAQVALDMKQQGATRGDLAVSEARVRQANTAVVQAQAALAKATLVAPFDGTVTSLMLRQGEMISAGAQAVTLADLSQLHVETADVDEWGAAHLQIGQAVRVTVNAFTAKALTGKVIEIASQSTTLPSGGISYVVTIELDQRDPDLRWGMTAKVDFHRQLPIVNTNK